MYISGSFEKFETIRSLSPIFSSRVSITLTPQRTVFGPTKETSLRTNFGAHHGFDFIALEHLPDHGHGTMEVKNNHCGIESCSGNDCNDYGDNKALYINM